MVKPDSNTGREELAGLLGRVAREKCSIRLLKPARTSDTKTRGWLFPSSKGKYGQLIKELVGPMLEIVQARPKLVELTGLGIETLVRNTPQNERPALVEQASERYRADILRSWQKFATRGEEELLQAAIRDSFGEWFPRSEQSQKSELDNFRELFVQEVADSWQAARTADARNRLAHLLKILGAEQMGKPNETVVFTGLQHTPLGPLFKGDPAKVVQPGWLFPKQPSPLLLVKAEVEPQKNQTTTN